MYITYLGGCLTDLPVDGLVDAQVLFDDITSTCNSYIHDDPEQILQMLSVSQSISQSVSHGIIYLTCQLSPAMLSCTVRAGIIVGIMILPPPLVVQPYSLHPGILQPSTLGTTNTFPLRTNRHPVLIPHRFNIPLDPSLKLVVIPPSSDSNLLNGTTSIVSSVPNTPPPFWTQAHFPPSP